MTRAEIQAKTGLCESPNSFILLRKTQFICLSQRFCLVVFQLSVTMRALSAGAEQELLLIVGCELLAVMASLMVGASSGAQRASGAVCAGAAAAACVL